LFGKESTISQQSQTYRHKTSFIRQRVQAGDIKLEFCKSEDMVADMLTKGLNMVQFAKLRDMVGLKKKPSRE